MMDVLKVLGLFALLFVQFILPFSVAISAGIRLAFGLCGSRPLMGLALALSLPLCIWDINNKGRHNAYTDNENIIIYLLMSVSLIAIGFWFSAMRHTPEKSRHVWIEFIAPPIITLWWIFTTRWIVH